MALYLAFASGTTFLSEFTEISTGRNWLSLKTRFPKARRSGEILSKWAQKNMAWTPASVLPAPIVAIFSLRTTLSVSSRVF
jgi:hypothetical protein